MKIRPISIVRADCCFSNNSWAHDAAGSDRRNVAYRRGVAQLARWHKQCEERRRVAAMSPSERKAWLIKNDPVERVLYNYERYRENAREKYAREHDKKAVGEV